MPFITQIDYICTMSSTTEDSIYIFSDFKILFLINNGVLLSLENFFSCIKAFKLILSAWEKDENKV